MTLDAGLNVPNVGSSFYAVRGGAAHFNTPPFSRIGGNNQGTFIGWNESYGQGESNFINNRGGGVGGFTFRTVNAGNTAETGKVSFNGTGAITATGGCYLWWTA